MAGGKETPRQKMIGMMYLVLTALLALQIKDTVLEKFVLIENGLQTSNEAFFDYNQGTLVAIQQDVENQGGKTGDVAVQKAAENLRKYTTGLVTFIDDLKLEVGRAATGGDESKIYERSTLKKYEEPSTFLVNNGNADELKQRLDAYPEQVNALVSFLGKGAMGEEWMSTIATDANDIAFYENNQEEKKKNFAEFNFYKAPLASVLAQLTFYKNQIYNKEAEVLNKLRGLVGTAVAADPDAVPDLGGLDPVAAAPREQTAASASEDEADNTPQTRPSTGGGNQGNVDEIAEDDYLKGAFAGIDYAQATILSESNLVTNGLDFTAQAFLTLGNSSLQPTIKLNGQEVDVVNGRGVINFTTNAGANEFDANGIATKTFEVEIEAEDGTGGTIKRSTTHEYRVARPVIDVRSQSVEVLYLNCANYLNINVPALGPAYQPSFRVTGGEFTTGTQKGQITVAPTERAIKIDVSSDGKFIGTREFEAKPVPLPTLEVRPDRQAYDATAGFDGKPGELQLRLTADEDFQQRYPDDNIFLASKGTITILAGRTQKGQIPFDTPQSAVDLSPLQARIQSGDRIVISIEEIVRYNYKDEPIKRTFFDNVTININ